MTDLDSSGSTASIAARSPHHQVGRAGNCSSSPSRCRARAGRKTHQRGRLQEGRARGIGHQHVAGADDLQQAGHTQARIGPQLQRVQVLVVQALEQAVHRLQALQGLQVQALAAHREVAALDQRDAQVARQVGVLEIGFVVGAGRQQHHVGVGAGRAHVLDAVDQCAVGGGQALHMQFLERLWEQARDRQPVLQQVAQAGGRLGALGHHPPVAVGSARQVEGADMQVRVGQGLHAVHGAQVARMALHQRRRQQALGQQALRAVDVGHHAVEHAHPLQHAGLDLAPAVGRDDQREQVQRPGPLRVGGVGVEVVGDAVVAQLALQLRAAVVQVGEAVAAQQFEELGPVLRQRGAGRIGARRAFAGRTRGAAQLVVVAGHGQARQRPGQAGCGLLALGVEEGLVVAWVHYERIVTSSSPGPVFTCAGRA